MNHVDLTVFLLSNSKSEHTIMIFIVDILGVGAIRNSIEPTVIQNECVTLMHARMHTRTHKRTHARTHKNCINVWILYRIAP